MKFRNKLSQNGLYRFNQPLSSSTLIVLLLGSFCFFSSSLMALDQVPEGGFEVPDLDPGGFVYNPPSTAWSYFGGTGVSANNSGFTRRNPPAPEGDQVLFIQRTGFLTQSLNLSAGDYQFNFKAAQRGNLNQGGQTFTIKLNGQLLGTFTPNDTKYQSYSTSTVSMDAGNYVLELRGTNPLGGDNTAFLDDLSYTFTPTNFWSDPQTWPGGLIPGPTTEATIPIGKTVILDVDADVKNLRINGKLIADQSKNLNLSANWILVEGTNALLQWGTEASPYLMDAVITLKHDPADYQLGPGMKFLAAKGGGQVEIHGENKMGWTQLNATADANTNVITLKENPGWEIGDQIVIASTDFDPHQAEVRTITQVSNGGLTLSLNANLNVMHWGQLLGYDFNRHFLDERAEVGLLSRNIKIQGDAASEVDGIGGHTMFMPSSTVHFSGVELYRMGQRDSLARYPFHWHVAGNVNGQYIKDCSIHRSYNRVVTVHGTDYALVEGNVGYDHIGHGYFLEDGNEIKNAFRRNLGILTRAPADEVGVTPHDYIKDAQTGLLKLPATFWITNPDNYFEGNAAAGSEGSGFWMVAQDNTLGQAPPIDPAPGLRDLLQFDDNRAHSNSFSNFSIDGRIERGTNLFKTGHYAPFNPDGSQIIPQVLRFTGYKCKQRNVWMRANTIDFEDCSLADSPRNTFFAFNQVLSNSLIVGESANIGNLMTNYDTIAGRSLARPDKPSNHIWNIISGHTVYDGPSGLFNVHLANFNGNDAYAFRINGAAIKSTVHYAEGITFENVPEQNKVNFRNQNWLETMFTSGLIDRDGSITGNPGGGHITPQILPINAADTKIREEGFNIEAGAEFRNTWYAYINTNEHFGLLINRNDWRKIDRYPSYNIRSDGPATYGQQAPGPHNQNPVIVNNANLKYYWQYHKIPNQFRPKLKFVNLNDYLISVYTNMPSSTLVYKDLTGSVPLEQASSLLQLINSPSQMYFLKDNSLYIKHVANTLGSFAKFGQDFKYISPDIRICQNQDCLLPKGLTTNVNFADFEMNGDSRVIPQSSGSLPTPIISVNSSNPNDTGISWTMTNDQDATDEYTQVKFEIPRQVWTDFQYLIINLTGVNRFKVHIRDDSQGVKSLGTFFSGNQVAIPLNTTANKDYLDEVVKLIIRVKESHMGAITSTINLFDIKLSLTAPTSTAAAIPNLNNQSIAVSTSEELQVFPNPTNDDFQLSMNFETNDELRLDFFDLAGRKLSSYDQQVVKGLWQQQFSAQQFKLTPGMYQIRVSTKFHGSQVMKLVINNR